jgi:polyhydroxybutyrate depolymerase
MPPGARFYRSATIVGVVALALVLVSLGAGDHDRSLAIGGATRTYIVHVPPRVSEGRPLPAVFAFHGGGGNASGFKAYAGLDALADREGFVVVYPDGSGRSGRRLLTWNAGGCCGYAAAQNVDDVGFTLAVLRDVARNVSVDAARVYATGHSNGAMMAYRLAIEASERLAAIAPVAGVMQAASFPPPRPVSVLHIHSVEDPRALYAGGLGPPFPGTQSRVTHRAVEPELRRWVAYDRCPAESRTVEQRTTPARGGPDQTATLLVWGPCAGGAEVQLWKLTGAGHGWPGGHVRLPETVMGPETVTIDAALEVWRFVSRFRRPDAPAPDAR